MSPYAELQVTSNFSFLRGASKAEELMVQAEVLGISALGFCDRNTLAGVVRPWTARRKLGLKVRALTGCRLDFADDTPSLLCYPTDRAAYGRLTRMLTDGQRRCDKGGCELHLEDFLVGAQGQAVIAVPPDRPDAAFEAQLPRADLVTTISRGSPGSTPSRRGPGSRSWPPMTSSITPPNAGPCRTS